jgi:hypothetical protein
MKPHVWHHQDVQIPRVQLDGPEIIDMFEPWDLVVATLYEPKGVEIYLQIWESWVSSVDEQRNLAVYRKDEGDFDRTGFEFVRYIRIPGDYLTEEKLRMKFGETLPIDWALVGLEMAPMSVYLGKVENNKITPTDIKVQSVQKRSVTGLIDRTKDAALKIHFA